jgi:S1-C subfamily serine protease
VWDPKVSHIASSSSARELISAHIFCRDDFIVAVDGREVSHKRDLLDAIGMNVGKTLTLTIRRGGEVNNAGSDFTVQLTTAPEEPKHPKQLRRGGF